MKKFTIFVKETSGIADSLPSNIKEQIGH